VIAVHAAPQVGDQVQAGIAQLVTGKLAWMGDRWASVEAHGVRMMFPHSQLLMLTERHVVVESADPGIDLWSGPIEHAAAELKLGTYEATSTEGDLPIEHIGQLHVAEGEASWRCHYRCMCDPQDLPF
jgi:hypothetical protein